MSVKYLLLVFILTISNLANAQNTNLQKTKDSLAVTEQLKKFVEAFKNLEFDKFQTFFSDDVTVFFPPSALVADRINGKEKAMEVFKNFFDKVRKSKAAPPYLDINPQKLQINIFEEIAIVTFELDDKDALSRRTIIFKKQNGQFMIIHLHASKIDK
ncbi:MAG TPA: nuclear transport factor 2 family protein [Puia sp.]|nr:nuclear transport factor 2 family protein [Puia sp.]